MTAARVLEDRYGLLFNAQGRLVDVNGHNFMFDVFAGDHKSNQDRYDAIGNNIVTYVYELLAQHLQKIYLRNDGQGTFIFASEGYDTCEKLLVLIHGMGAVRAGQWSRRLIINDCLDNGTQLPYIRRALDMGWGVIVTNTNDTHEGVEGSRSPADHGQYVWKHFIKGKSNKKIAIVAHSAGGNVTTSMLNDNEQDFRSRVYAIAYTDAFATPNLSANDYFISVTTNWVTNSNPVGTELCRPGAVRKRRSAGTLVHEETSHCAIDEVFKYLIERFKNPSPMPGDRGNVLLKGKMKGSKIASNVGYKIGEQDFRYANQEQVVHFENEDNDFGYKRSDNKGQASSYKRDHRQEQDLSFKRDDKNVEAFGYKRDKKAPDFSYKREEKKGQAFRYKRDHIDKTGQDFSYKRDDKNGQAFGYKRDKKAQDFSYKRDDSKQQNFGYKRDATKRPDVGYKRDDREGQDFGYKRVSNKGQDFGYTRDGSKGHDLAYKGYNFGYRNAGQYDSNENKGRYPSNEKNDNEGLYMGDRYNFDYENESEYFGYESDRQWRQNFGRGYSTDLNFSYKNDTESDYENEGRYFGYKDDRLYFGYENNGWLSSYGRDDRNGRYIGYEGDKCDFGYGNESEYFDYDKERQPKQNFGRGYSIDPDISYKTGTDFGYDNEGLYFGRENDSRYFVNDSEAWRRWNYRDIYGIDSDSSSESDGWDDDVDLKGHW